MKRKPKVQEKTSGMGEWSHPIPVKLESTDYDWLKLICVRSGLKKAQVLRRSVRLLGRVLEQNPDLNWQQQTAKALPPLTEAQRRELEEVPGDEPTTFETINHRAKEAAERERKEKLAAAEAEARRLAQAAAAAQAEADRLRGQ